MIERREEMLEQVHQLMLMYSVDARRDSLDAAMLLLLYDGSTDYKLLDVENGAAQLKVLKTSLNWLNYFKCMPVFYRCGRCGKFLCYCTEALLKFRRSTAA